MYFGVICDCPYFDSPASYNRASCRAAALHPAKNRFLTSTVPRLIQKYRFILNALHVGPWLKFCFCLRENNNTNAGPLSRPPVGRALKKYLNSALGPHVTLPLIPMTQL